MLEGGSAGDKLAKIVGFGMWPELLLSRPAKAMGRVGLIACT